MKAKKNLIFYYLCCIFMFVLTPILYKHYQVYDAFNDLSDGLRGQYLIIINVIMTIIFTALVIKIRKVRINNLVFPISFIIFYIAVWGLCLLFNNKVMLPGLHIAYYLNFVVIYFTALNIYYLLSINCEKKKKIEVKTK